MCSLNLQSLFHRFFKRRPIFYCKRRPKPSFTDFFFQSVVFQFTYFVYILFSYFLLFTYLLSTFFFSFTSYFVKYDFKCFSFQRLHLAGYPVLMLETQYRMHRVSKLITSPEKYKIATS